MPSKRVKSVLNLNEEFRDGFKASAAALDIGASTLVMCEHKLLMTLAKMGISGDGMTTDIEVLVNGETHNVVLPFELSKLVLNTEVATDI
jgi:hypothetical protein